MSEALREAIKADVRRQMGAREANVPSELRNAIVEMKRIMANANKSCADIRWAAENEAALSPGTQTQLSSDLTRCMKLTADAERILARY